jgi:predicted transcriptional regulator
MLTKVDILTIGKVRELLKAELLCGDDPSLKVERVGAADLLSDVLALSKPGTLLLTGLTNAQVVRTAVIADLCGLVFVRGKRPSENVLKLAREANLPVLSTKLRMFDAAGLLYMSLYGG